MPNINYQKDRDAKSKKEATHNKDISNADNKDAAIKVAVSALDAAKNKGVIHKNSAARKISRMAKRNNKAAAAE